MWRWVGGLIALAAFAWAFWPSGYVRVTVLTQNTQDVRFVRGIGVQGPHWMNSTYFTWTWDDEVAAATVPRDIPEKGTSYRVDINLHELQQAPTSAVGTWTIKIIESPEKPLMFILQDASGIRRSAPLREDAPESLARFLAKQYRRTGIGIGIQAESEASK